jgi:hypothetical protein
MFSAPATSRSDLLLSQIIVNVIPNRYRKLQYSSDFVTATPPTYPCIVPHPFAACEVTTSTVTNYVHVKIDRCDVIPVASIPYF